jgi:hypothetical protein
VKPLLLTCLVLDMIVSMRSASERVLLVRWDLGRLFSRWMFEKSSGRLCRRLIEFKQQARTNHVSLAARMHMIDWKGKTSTNHVRLAMK